MKFGLRAIAVAAALTMVATTAPSPSFAAVPGLQDQDRRDQQRHDDNKGQHPDYSNNRYYNLGNREGYQDYNKKQQRKDHNHKYRSDDDRQAHDYGYQQGLQGQRGYHDDRQH